MTRLFAASRRGTGRSFETTAVTWRRSEKRHYAKLANHFLISGCKLSRSRPAEPAPEDWAEIVAFLGIDPTQVTLRRVSEKLIYFSWALTKWLERGGCRTQVVWLNQSFHIRLSPQSLFAAIGLSLCVAVGEDRVQCFECKRSFRPKRRLEGKRQFCPKCGRRAAMKHIMRERRRRMKLEGELRA